MGRIEHPDRLRFRRAANPLGIGPRLGEQLVVLPIGLAFDHLVLGQSRRAIAVGDFFPLAFHALEHGLLISLREIEPGDPQVDDLDSEPVAQRFRFASPAQRLFAHGVGQPIERAGFILGRPLLGIPHSKEVAQLDLPQGGRQDRANAALEPGFGDVAAAESAIKAHHGPLERIGPRLFGRRIAGRRSDSPTDVDIDRDVLLIACEHLAGRWGKQLHAAVEPTDEIDRPGELEMRPAIGLAIVDPHDAAKSLDDHRFPLVDENHARGGKR